ncbi:MAG: lipid-A-disaccharide synthase [Robiginitomaculum sp.]|nr:MAG: lipid-A-disaccharide synthase [Robiginitomaculum sp.]
MAKQKGPDAPVRIFLVAGEASGDILAAELIEPLRERFGSRVEFAGIGGPAMAAKGITSPVSMSQLSVLGFMEGLMAWRRISMLAKKTASIIDAFQADIVVLVDSWGFTMRVARAVRVLRPQAVLTKYVGPQVWATRPGRAAVLANMVDQLLTIHAFDAPFYENTSLPVSFVGNPVLSRKVVGDGIALRKTYKVGQHDKVLLVLFGSRHAEFSRLQAPFMEAVQTLREKNPGITVFCPLSHAIAIQVRAAAVDDPRFKDVVFLDEADKEDAFAAADLALACSGTVTTELAAVGVAMVVGYKVSPVTWALLKTFFLKTGYASLVNVATDTMIVPEYIQGACQPAALCAALDALLNDDNARSQQQKALAGAVDKMGSNGPPTAHRAAEAIHKFWQNTP